MRFLATSLLTLAALAWPGSDGQAQNPTPPTAATAQSGQPALSTDPLKGPDGWRYTWSRGRWWYWLPEQRWMFWERGRWVDYMGPATRPTETPRSTFAEGAQPSGQPGYRGYQPYSSAYPPQEEQHYALPCPSVPYRAAPDYGPGWGWGNGWNGQGYRWRSEWR